MMSAADTGNVNRRRQHIWVILPAYNEELSLPPLLERIDESMFEAGLTYRVLLVDDGSKDDTLKVAEDFATRIPLTIEKHEVNMGLGATIRDGLLKVSELAEPNDILVTMDADNSHTPALIQRMVRQVREGHDVVIASRYQRGSSIRGVSLGRRALSYWGGWLFRIMFPIHGVRDYTCGYRAYRAEVMQRVAAKYGKEFFDQEGFQCMVDILLKLRRMDLIFGEVPFVLRYDMKEGASKMNIFKTIKNTLGLMAKRRMGG
jgi:dolichol-phosphate mannosyltransferase